MDEEETVHKPWETEYEKTWEILQEDEEGKLHTSLEDEAYKAKRRKLFEKPDSVRLGMMRHLFLVVDTSRAMSEKDLKPDRIKCTLKVLENFVSEFFDQNPISQMGVIATKKGRAEKVAELSGNPQVLCKALNGIQDCEGDPSLQNSLQMAMRGLKHIPSHASKEVLVVLGSLTSCDPGNIFKVIEDLKSVSVRCSIVGLAAEVRLCKSICQTTLGAYSVILNESHFRDVLMQHCRPPPAKESSEATLMRMGFPKHFMNGPLSACLCHLDQRDPEYISTSGYHCPRCGSKYCELPVECRVCALTLVLAPHLARSYHHLFPLTMFEEQLTTTKQYVCAGCQVVLQSKLYVCPECGEVFCIDCDLYIHETLHNCPGCTSRVSSSSPIT